MTATLRQLFVLLLALLQLAAPLLHAHKGGQSQTGLHLYEFEQLIHPAGAPEFTGLVYQSDTSGCIVSISCAIKQSPQSVHDDGDSVQLFFPPVFWALPQRLLGYWINFSPQPSQVAVPTPLSKAHSSRAPPFPG